MGPRRLGDFLGNSRVRVIISRALANGRLPHAMIFAGPSGVGKRTFALLLAQAINCTEPVDRDACGRCRSCSKILSGNHPDVQEIRPEGAFIKIEQIRAVIREVAFQPFEGRHRVVVLDAADQMRAEAANSLLKTLEEPSSRSYLILVTTNPYALLDTIRSRCRMIPFAGLAQGILEESLLARGTPREEARLAAWFSNGSLGAALSFDAPLYRSLRDQAIGFVRVVLTRGGFAEATRQAAPVAKEKESFGVWLDLVSSLFEDLFYAQVAPDRVIQQDIAPDLEALAQSVSRQRLLSAIEAIARLRTALRTNANRLIALERLYLEQAAEG